MATKKKTTVSKPAKAEKELMTRNRLSVPNYIHDRCVVHVESNGMFEEETGLITSFQDILDFENKGSVITDPLVCETHQIDQYTMGKVKSEDVLAIARLNEIQIREQYVEKYNEFKANNINNSNKEKETMATKESNVNKNVKVSATDAVKVPIENDQVKTATTEQTNKPAEEAPKTEAKTEKTVDEQPKADAGKKEETKAEDNGTTIHHVHEYKRETWGDVARDLPKVGVKMVFGTIVAVGTVAVLNALFGKKD